MKYKILIEQHKRQGHKDTWEIVARSCTKTGFGRNAHIIADGYYSLEQARSNLKKIRRGVTFESYGK